MASALLILVCDLRVWSVILKYFNLFIFFFSSNLDSKMSLMAVDQLNYFKFLFVVDNWLILDNFNKKGRILQPFLSAQSGLTRNKRPFPSVY